MSNEEMKIEEMVDNSEKLNTVKQINCQIGESGKDETSGAVTSSPSKSISELSPSGGARTKRKSRSTRRRLNAMMNNTSLHFSDTDSEGELTLINSHGRNTSPCKNPNVLGGQNRGVKNLSNPTISVTLEGGDALEKSKVEGDPQWQGFADIQSRSRVNSFVENLTDVDEIYTSDPEIEGIGKNDDKNLTIVDNSCQGAETDYEDFSNDEAGDYEPSPIYVAPRNDILCDFTGGTITTKEGDGPFSIEVRNQMSFDHGFEHDNTEFTDKPDIVIMPTTDSEDMEDPSDDEDAPEGACGQREMLDDFDLLAASQIVMKNINKMENSLSVRDISDNDISDCHTDVEDVD